MHHNRNAATNLWMDIILLIAFLILYEEHATGNLIHEWLGISIAVLLIVHILLHIRWITCVLKNFIRKLTFLNRFRLVMNMLIFISFSSIIFSGIMMSKNVMPFFGLRTIESGYWRWLHATTVDITLWMSAVHIAINWKPLLKMIRAKPFFPLRDITTPLPEFARSVQGTGSGKGYKFTSHALYAVTILALSGIISLSWYGLSHTGFADNIRPGHHLENPYEMTGNDRQDVQPIPERYRRDEDRHRENEGHGRHGRDEISYIGIVPGVTKNLLFISAITAVIVISGKGIRKLKTTTNDPAGRDPNN